MATIGDCIDAATTRLRAAGSATRPARRRAAARLRDRGRPDGRSSPIATRRSAPTRPPRFEAAVARREAGEPVAYIRGIKEFHGLAFAVDRAGADPAAGDRGARRRGDRGGHAPAATAGEAGAARCGGDPIRVADVGTGSGAIASRVAVALRKRGVPTDDVTILAADVVAGRAGPRPRERGRARRRRRHAVRRGATCCRPSCRPARRSTSSWPTCRTSAPRRSPGLPMRARRSSRASRSTAGRTASTSIGRCSTCLPKGSRPTGSPCWRSAPTRARRSARWPWTACPAGVHGRAGPRRAAAGRPSRARARSVAMSPEVDLAALPSFMPDVVPRTPARSFPIRLIALDIDGTLIGDDLVLGRADARGGPRGAGSRRRGLARHRPDDVHGDALRPRARPRPSRSSPTRARLIRAMPPAGCDPRLGRLLLHTPLPRTPPGEIIAWTASAASSRTSTTSSGSSSRPTTRAPRTTRRSWVPERGARRRPGRWIDHPVTKILAVGEPPMPVQVAPAARAGSPGSGRGDDLAIRGSSSSSPRACRRAGRSAGSPAGRGSRSVPRWRSATNGTTSR